MKKKYIMAFAVVCIMAITGITIKTKQEEKDMHVLNISVEISDEQFMAMKRRAARISKSTESWTVHDEVNYTAAAAIALQAEDEIKREQAALRRSQITDDFITDDTPIRVVAAQKKEQTLSEDPKGEPDANADSSQNTEAKNARRIVTTQQERDLFLRCIQAEAGNQPIEGRQAAAEVILNRVDDPHFPGTITDVIMQPKQFGVVTNGSINNVTPDKTTIKAVDDALEFSAVLPRDYVFFNNAPIGNDPIKIGDHYFGR